MMINSEINRNESNSKWNRKSKNFKNFFRYHWRGFVLVMVPLIFSFLLFQQPIKQMRCAYLLIVMAAYWISEALPIPITSMMPIVAFPLMGILDSNTVCQQYFDNTTAFFLFSMIVALALESSNLHKRMALFVISLIGFGPKRLHFSVTLLAMFTSFWLANHAVATLMCPIVKAILEEQANHASFKLYKENDSSDDADSILYPSRVAIAYYLGIAYAASIGGCATLMGSGVNLIFFGIFTERFPRVPDMDFTHFLIFNLPIVVAITILVALWLEFLFLGLGRVNSEDAKAIRITKERRRLANKAIKQRKTLSDPWTVNEVVTATLFLALIVLLFTQSPGLFIGWADLLSETNVGSSAATGFVVLLIFMLPNNLNFLQYFVCRGKFYSIAHDYQRPIRPLLTWPEIVRRLPWGTMLLLGGGMALSAGIVSSGLANRIGEMLKIWQTFPKSVVQLCCLLVTIGFTAVCANAAVCSILTPIFLEMSVVLQLHPAFIGLPSAMLSALSFHFPMSTPPNAIIAEYANIQTKDMCLAGIGPTIIAVLVYLSFSHFWGPIVFKDFLDFPEWAT